MVMRQPSTTEDAFRWWRAALADRTTPRIEDIPEAGYFAMRLVKGGPLVPVAIWLEQEIEGGELVAPEKLAGIVSGKSRGQEWLRARWTYMRPITAEAYDALTGAHIHVPDMAATETKLDLAAAPVIRPQRRA